MEDRWILSRLTHAIQRTDAALEGYNPSAAVGALREFFWNELCDWYLEFVKPRMRDDAAAPVARQVVAHCIDQVLRLMHPFVPFVTEALWNKLGELASERGIDAPITGTDGLLVVAPWPTPTAAWRDEAVEARVAFAQEIVTRIREVRATSQVAPSTKVDVVLRTGDASARTLDGLEVLIAGMANATSVAIQDAFDKPKDAATAVVRDVDCFVLGVVDLDKERAKLEKLKDELEKRIGGAKKKLDNPGFVAKAPPEVVAKEQQRVADLEQQLASVTKNLEEL